MKKLISIAILAGAVLLALAFTRMAGSKSGAPCGPYPAPGYPSPVANPCNTDQVPASCQILRSYSYPKNPFYFHPDEHAVCYILIDDDLGQWGFPYDYCWRWGDGPRCVSGMNSTGSLVKVSGPLPFKAVTVFWNWRVGLPVVVKR